MWAARPHLANIFEKLLDQKTFYSPAARDWKPNLKNNLLRKCGLLAHTSPAFLKNYWSKKLFIFSSVFRQLFTKSRICAKMKTIEKNRRQ